MNENSHPSRHTIKPKPDNFKRMMIPFIIFWNLFALPIGVISFIQVFRKNNPAMFVGFMFPIVGILLIWLAFHELLGGRSLRKGKFALRLVSGHIGGELHGQIFTF